MDQRDHSLPSGGGCSCLHCIGGVSAEEHLGKRLLLLIRGLDEHPDQASVESRWRREPEPEPASL
jgi:hypothetical protein